MRRSKKICLVFLLVFLAATAIGLPRPDPSDDCRQALKKYFKTEQDYARNVLASGKVWTVQYSVESEVFNPKTKLYQTIISNGKLRAATGWRYVKSDSLEMYMDSTDLFTMRTSPRAITRMPSIPSQLAVRNDMYNNLLNDSLFKTYELVSCANTNLTQKSKTTCIEYVLLPKNKATAQFTRLAIYIEQGTGIFRGLAADCNTALSKQVKNFNFFIVKRAEEGADRGMIPVKNKFLETNGRLKPAFKHFAYEDYRDKKYKKNSPHK